MRPTLAPGLSLEMQGTLLLAMCLPSWRRRFASADNLASFGRVTIL